MDNINRKVISEKINNNEPFNINFKFAGRNIIMIINSIIAKMLAKMDRIFLLNSIVTIIREIIVNCQKANAKRIYFHLNNLDIKDPASYKKGMELFKKNVVGNFDIFYDKIMSSDYFVDLYFEIHEDKLFVKVTNNAPIMPEELQRINLRFEKAIKYNDFSEAYEEIEDDSEGAGLGIVITILFLKSMGVNPRMFKIESDGRLTTTTLTIPKQLRPVQITTKIRDQIINEVEGIPTFPENIIELQRLCSDAEASIEEITRRIMLDPALSIDVIKLSNSAGFVPGKRIESVHTAVMTIGLKNVNAILTASNARRILNERYSQFEQIWEHCNKTAFYSRIIASTYRLSGIVEYAFMAGLLHDMGKIILLSADKKLVMRIADQVKERKIISSTIMEEISIGISHSKIGELVSNKWNFPGYLVEAIKYHHSPLSADDKYRDIVFTVYLANMMCGIDDRKYYFYYLDESVLERFNLGSEEEFNAFHKKLKEQYQETKAL